MKSKRGQGLPMNTIVIAAIVLVVMVVLILIFTGRMGQTTTELKTCLARGGICVATESECKVTEGEKIIEDTDCKDPLPVCCRKLPT